MILEAEHRETCDALWRLGELSWLLDEHQRVRIYDHYRDWESSRAANGGDGGASRIWMLDAGRQVGKTFTIDLIKVEDCLRKPGSKHLLASAEEIALKEFVLPNIETIIATAPDDIRPKFVAHRNGMKAAYYFANGSILKLVGIDKNVDGLRGPRLDGAAISEAGFVRHLKRAINGIIYPQFQRVPGATLILESSAPSEPDHDFDVVFRPSCERRNAYVFLTIEDNTALDPATREEFVAAAREIDPVDAQREYYGVRVRNPRSTVFTAFDRSRHVLEADPPRRQYGIALTAMDPGQRHQYGMLWSRYDHIDSRVIIEDCWAESNPSTERVAAICAARELDLYGTHPPAQLARLPLDDARDGLGWRSLLAGDRCEHLAERLHELAQRDSEASEWQWYDNDARRFTRNPHARVSDVELQVINDLSNTYGLHVIPTTKESLRAMTGFANAKLSQGQVVFAPRASLAAQHVNAAQWEPNRTKFAEHNVYAHYDLAACFVYAIRYWEQLTHLWPEPPEHWDRKPSPDFVGDPYAHTEEGGMWG